jgi:uracil-DNA glycosylase
MTRNLYLESSFMSRNIDFMIRTLDDARMLIADIRACTLCAAHLAAGPRPIVQFSATARILIIGQAPGTRVHESGIPWDDASGDRLRDWTGLTKAAFYNPAKIALMPMGFCYPGTGKSGDLPPRPECAPLWHDQVLALLPPDRLTLLVGSYAQARYLPPPKPKSLTDAVRAGATGNIIPLPHPSWRSSGWMARNAWFESDILPPLREAVAAYLAG